MSDSTRETSSVNTNPRPSVSVRISAEGVWQGGRKLVTGAKVGGVGEGEKMVVGMTDENTGVMDDAGGVTVRLGAEV